MLAAAFAPHGFDDMVPAACEDELGALVDELVELGPALVELLLQAGEEWLLDELAEAALMPAEVLRGARDSLLDMQLEHERHEKSHETKS